MNGGFQEKRFQEVPLATNESKTLSARNKKATSKQ